jgi:hypothetical protein
MCYHCATPGAQVVELQAEMARPERLERSTLPQGQGCVVVDALIVPIQASKE